MPGDRLSQLGWETVRSLALVVLLLCSSLTAAGASVSAQSTIQQTQNFTATGSSDAKRKVVYGNGSNILHAYWSNNSTTSLGVSAVAIGPMADFGSDNEMEVPFVNSSGALKLIEPDGDTTTLVTSGNGYVGDYSLGVGDWDGDGYKAVFYSYGSSGKILHRIEPAGDDSDGVSFGVKSKGTGGVADIDSDNRLEIVYSGGSGQLRYYNKDGTSVKTSWGASGIGIPHDFDGDGNASVPVVDGSNNVKLISIAEDSATDLGANSKKTRIGLANVTGNSTAEILYLDTKDSPAQAKYVTLSGETAYLHDDAGTRIEVSKDVGIASILAVAPTITDYDVTNPTGREIEVSFNASKDLSDIAVEITHDGTLVTTLTESEIDQTASDPYRYVGNYTVNVDGNYTATLTKAVGPNGLAAEESPSETIAVQTPTPTVSNVTLTDRTDGNNVVDAGHEIRVTADVQNESTITNVTADLSAFGLGTVELTKSGGQWTVTRTVDTDAVDGSHTVPVTAINEYDHADTNESGTLIVDTTPPDLEVPGSRTVDEDTKVAFDADSTDLTNVSYVWQFPDGTTATGERVTHVFSDPGSYTVNVTATDAAGNAETANISVDVQNVNETDPVPYVTNVTLIDATNGDGVVTSGDSVRVTAEVLNESNLTSVTADLSMLGVGTVNLTKSGGQWTATRTVDSDAANGVFRTSVTAVNEYDNADANESNTFVVDMLPPDLQQLPNRTIQEDTTVVFDADSTDLTAVSYTWTLPNGSTVTSDRISYTFADPGTYTLTATATDAVGHSVTDTVTIEVTDAADGTGETEIVYLDGDDDTEGGTSGAGTQSDRERARKVIRTNVTLRPGQTVDVRVVHADANDSIAVHFRGQATLEKSVMVQGIEFVTLRPGNLSLRIHGLRDAPDRVEPLSARPAVSSVGYFRINHTISDRNLSNVELTLVIPKDKVETAAGPPELTVYRYHDGEWTAHEATRIGETQRAVRYSAHVPGLSVFGVGVQHAEIQLVRTTLTEERIRVGQDAEVTAVLRNNGTARGTRTVSLFVNGSAVATKEVSLAPDETRSITFTREFTDAGRYRLRIDNTTVGTVSVTTSEPTRTPTPQPDTTGSSGLLWLLGLLGIGLATGYVTYRRSDIEKPW